MTKKRFLSMLIVFVLMFSLFPEYSLAHSGKTDASGGHHDNNNVSGLGSYHYHCGVYPAHLHPYGYCPYKSVASKVTLSATKKSIAVGERLQIKSSISPSNASRNKLTWMSSDKKVATVDSKGVVKAVGKGTATITATSNDINGVSGKVTLNVFIKAKSISIKGTKEITSGKSTTLSIITSPAKAGYTSVKWRSSRMSVLTVSSTGKITAKPVKTTQTVKVTVTAMSGSKKLTATITIKVKPAK